jgi:ferredoxin--NADP+ reductase
MGSKWVHGTVVDQRRWTDRLSSIRIAAELDPFQGGQFCRLALEVAGERVARPYSFVNAPHERPHEFHYVRLDNGPLTSRLAALGPGDGVLLTPKPAGFLSVEEVPSADHLWMLATGTAIGPFLSILKTDAPWQRFGRVVLVHAVRMAAELSYAETVSSLLSAHPTQFAFVPFVSREDTSFAMRTRVPAALRDGRLEDRAGLPIGTASSQVMICGNPAMLEDTLAVLESRGLKRHKRKGPGNIHVESYW